MEDIILPNLIKLEKKKSKFKKEGLNSIHIISDFDRTLTKAFFKGEKTPSLISHIRNGNYLTKDYATKSKELFNRYHPIEISKEIPKEEKNKKMLEWWSNHYKLLTESGLDEPTIKKSVTDLINEGKIKLREGVADFLNTTNKNNIPFIILSSAGIGNMVTEFLNKQNLIFHNIYFIGNTLKFNKNNRFIGIKDNKIIHIFNKNEAEIKSLPIYPEIAKRKNVILIGDSIEDIKMVEGFRYNSIIKIGFYNGYEDNLEDFKKNFDIVLINDSSFEAINNLLKEII
jgi:5'-nucleotidase